MLLAFSEHIVLPENPGIRFAAPQALMFVAFGDQMFNTFPGLQYGRLQNANCGVYWLSPLGERFYYR